MVDTFIDHLCQILCIISINNDNIVKFMRSYSFAFKPTTKIRWTHYIKKIYILRDTMTKKTEIVYINHYKSLSS